MSKKILFKFYPSIKFEGKTMSISLITPYNTSKLNRYNKTKTISFKQKEVDSIKQWCSLFEHEICNIKSDKKLRAEKTDSLLKILESETRSNQAKILLDPNFRTGTIFDAALCYDDYAATSVWNYVKEKTDKNIQGGFIIGANFYPDETAFFKAAKAHEFELSEDILDFVDKKLDERLKKKFFNMKVDGKTQYDHLIESGFVDLADRYEAIASKYIDSIEGTPRNNRTQRAASDSKYGNTENYRIYKEVKTKFADVGGLFNVKNQIENELLAILKNPKVKNADKPSGVILYGPPGTGKSLLATAIAGEAEVPFVSTEGSSFAEVYVGAGPANVRKLYAAARELAKEHPSKTAIVFIDEVDAVGGKRGESSNSERDNTLNALLSEMDGVKSKEESDIKIITLLATNRKDMLDSAFRKGRIDFEFKIDDPRLSEKARYEILSIHAKDKPFKDEATKEKFLRELAHSTSGFSGAELADLIKRAYRKTLYLGRQVDYITQDDIRNAKLESMVGIKNDSEITEYEQKTTIAHEAGHAVNLVLMDKIFENEQTLAKKPVSVLDMIVNEPRGTAAGMTLKKPSSDNIGRYTVESLVSSLVVTYGGYSIEEKMFGCHTDGVSSDLETNTKKIYDAVTKYGLGSKTKYLSVLPNGQFFELYKTDIKKDIELYSATAMKISDQLAKFSQPFIEKYTEKFLNEPVKIISGDDFIEMFESWIKESNKKKEYDELSRQVRLELADLREKLQEK